MVSGVQKLKPPPSAYPRRLERCVLGQVTESPPLLYVP